MASIQDISHKFKSLLGSDAVFTSLLIVLVGIASFGLGRASLSVKGQDSAEAGVVLTTTAPEPPSVGVKTSAKAPVLAPTSTPATTEPLLVGSKNGTKYHYLWCPGASQMKEENKMYFASREEAERLGYAPAANCKGL